MSYKQTKNHCGDSGLQKYLPLGSGKGFDMTFIRKIFRGDDWYIEKPIIEHAKPMNIVVYSHQERFDLFLFDARSFDEIFERFEEE